VSSLGKVICFGPPVPSAGTVQISVPPQKVKSGRNFLGRGTNVAYATYLPSGDGHGKASLLNRVQEGSINEVNQELLKPLVEYLGFISFARIFWASLGKAARLRKRREIITASGADTEEHFKGVQAANLGITFEKLAKSWLEQSQNRLRRPMGRRTARSWRCASNSLTAPRCEASSPTLSPLSYQLLRAAWSRCSGPVIS
jgi:hypothetical protein